MNVVFFFFFSSRRRHTIFDCDWSSDVCSSDLFAGQQCRVADHERGEVSETGELCLAGSQVTDGYWNSPEKTRCQFVRFPETGGTLWYRTGDLVKRGENGCLYYLGRIDHQVKIRGYRV